MQATLLTLAAEHGRTETAYERSDSLTWRDAGCLLATLQLVSVWLGLAACPLGVLGDAIVAACDPTGLLCGAGVLAVGEHDAPVRP